MKAQKFLAKWEALECMFHAARYVGLPQDTIVLMHAVMKHFIERIEAAAPPPTIPAARKKKAAARQKEGERNS